MSYQWDRNKKTFRNKPSYVPRNYDSLQMSECLQLIKSNGFYNNQVVDFPRWRINLFNNVDQEVMKHTYDNRTSIYRNLIDRRLPTVWSLTDGTQTLSKKFTREDVMFIQYVIYVFELARGGHITVEHYWDFNKSHRNQKLDVNAYSQVFTDIAKAMLEYNGRNKGKQVIDLDIVRKTCNIVAEFISDHKPKASPMDKLISLIKFNTIRIINRLKALKENEKEILEDILRNNIPVLWN